MFRRSPAGDAPSRASSRKKWRPDDHDPVLPGDLPEVSPSPEVAAPEVLAPEPVEGRAEPAPAPARAPRRWPLRRFWLVAPPLLLLLAASWFALPIRAVTVSGNHHLGAADVVRAAGVTPDFGWLYYGQRQASRLAANPWVASAEVTRQFPDRLDIHITERVPYAVLRESGAAPVAVARDGTRLPGVAPDPALPAITGWGPERITEALAVLEAARPYGVQSVEYTPTGLTVRTAAGSAWSGDLESLLKYAGALADYPNQAIHIYPWGVSVQE